MSPVTSPSPGRIYGVARALRELEMARSSFYSPAPRTEDRVDGCRPDRGDPSGAGGIAVLRRGPSQSVGPVAQGSKSVELFMRWFSRLITSSPVLRPAFSAGLPGTTLAISVLRPGLIV